MSLKVFEKHQSKPLHSFFNDFDLDFEYQLRASKITGKNGQKRAKKTLLVMTVKTFIFIRFQYARVNGKSFSCKSEAVIKAIGGFNEDV